MPPSVNHYAKGMFLTSDAGPAVERSRPQADDPSAEFDAHIKRAGELIDGLAALKAKAKATKEWQDFCWKYPWR
jgi:hypothetical protein